MNAENDGLIGAMLLDGAGGGHDIGWDGIRAWQPDHQLLWVHLDYTAPASQRWVREESGLDEVIAEALLAEETRPRSLLLKDGMLLTLRGVNLNPGADPEDMVAVRLWIDGRRIISTRKRRLLSVDDMRKALRDGRGPGTTGELVVELAERLAERMADVIGDIDSAVDELEERVLASQSYGLRTEIADLRRITINLRRYLAPQRDAMARLYTERVPWLDEMDRMHLREIADRTMRYIEDLDAARERASVTQEELMNRLSEQMNRRMYVLSIVAAIFLPLSFLTGLLGINVGGIPGADYKWAFFIFSGMLVVILAIQMWIFKIKHWF